MAIKVTPEMLRNTSQAIQHDMEHATAVANSYLSNQQNVMGSDSWSGDAVVASNATAEQIHADLQKVLTGGQRLAEGLTQAAALMEAHESDGSHAFSSLFGGAPQSV